MTFKTSLRRLRVNARHQTYKDHSYEVSEILVSAKGSMEKSKKDIVGGY